MSYFYRMGLTFMGVINKLRGVAGRGTDSGKYEFRLIIMREGVHPHHTVRKDNLQFKHKIEDVEYEVDPTTIYEWTPGLRRKLRWRLGGIKAGFIAVFREGTAKAISYKTPYVSPRLIKIIYGNRALTKALKDEFKEAMDVKRLFMIFLVLVVGLVLYLALTGQLKWGV